MTTSRDHVGCTSGYPRIELLEGRRLLSAAVPAITAADSTVSTPPATITSTTVLTGMKINAEADQPFRAVVGTMSGGPSLPTGYSVNGYINWGDGTIPSAAQLIRQPDGTVDILGAHNYTAVGVYGISVIVTAAPPPGSLAPVLLIGSFNSSANVITPDGGVTLDETAGVPFTATLGFFHSTLSSLTMTATITWGDGSQSTGKILALPTADLVPTFAVSGDHTYNAIGSYPVQITVYSSQPSPDPTATGTTPVILVAQMDSVIDVLPVLPTAVTSTAATPAAAVAVFSSTQVPGTNDLFHHHKHGKP